jgi:hypothetical protein
VRHLVFFFYCFPPFTHSLSLSLTFSLWNIITELLFLLLKLLLSKKGVCNSLRAVWVVDFETPVCKLYLLFLSADAAQEKEK